MKQTQNTNAIATAILEVLPDTPNAALLEILDKLDPIPPEVANMGDGELLAALEGMLAEWGNVRDIRIAEDNARAAIAKARGLGGQHAMKPTKEQAIHHAFLDIAHVLYALEIDEDALTIDIAALKATLEELQEVHPNTLTHEYTEAMDE